MTNTSPSIKLVGRIFLCMDIRAVTGLRIGGSPTALNIGGLDNVIIRSPLNNQPYIPGSSLRGKLRSLWEKATGLPQNFYVRRGNPTVRMHAITSEDVRDKSESAVHQMVHDDPVCRIFGVTGDIAVPNPTRLIVHDVMMSPDSVERLENARTDNPYTEIKWEATIDRITSAAVPRQMERIPADTVFSKARLVYSLYNVPDLVSEIGWFGDIVTMLQLLEDDYLGSSGSRGSGQISFMNLELGVRMTGGDGSAYSQYRPVHEGIYANLQEFSSQREELIAEIKSQFGV
jgi:CRISPR-associated protein Csm3